MLIFWAFDGLGWFVMVFVCFWWSLMIFECISLIRQLMNASNYETYQINKYLLIDYPLITIPGTCTVDQKSFNYIIPHNRGIGTCIIIIASSTLIIIKGAPPIAHPVQTQPLLNSLGGESSLNFFFLSQSTTQQSNK